MDKNVLEMISRFHEAENAPSLFFASSSRQLGYNEAVLQDMCLSDNVVTSLAGYARTDDLSVYALSSDVSAHYYTRPRIEGETFAKIASDRFDVKDGDIWMHCRPDLDLDGILSTHDPDPAVIFTIASGPSVDPILSGKTDLVRLARINREGIGISYGSTGTCRMNWPSDTFGQQEIAVRSDLSGYVRKSDLLSALSDLYECRITVGGFLEQISGFCS